MNLSGSRRRMHSRQQFRELIRTKFCSSLCVRLVRSELICGRTSGFAIERTGVSSIGREFLIHHSERLLTCPADSLLHIGHIGSSWTYWFPLCQFQQLGSCLDPV